MGSWVRICGAVVSAALTLTLTPTSIGQSTTQAQARGDYDGDGIADPVIFRPSTGEWQVKMSAPGIAGAMTTSWGSETDVPVIGDYDGDGKADIAFFRPSTGGWSILTSATAFSAAKTIVWGMAGDVPVPGDYDGDGRTDVAVFRPSTGMWLVLQSYKDQKLSFSKSWGAATDLPIAADFDGDGKADLAVFRPSTGQWLVLQSTSGFTTSQTVQFGMTDDVPVVADYDGDGRADFAVFRASDQKWYILQSATGSVVSYAWGLATDDLVPGDYDGDGRADLACFRPSTGAWWILLSRSGYTQSNTFAWGTAGDVLPLATPSTRRGKIDKTPPKISAVGATSTSTSATISWTTDEVSDSLVEYGTTTTYGSATLLNKTFVVAHQAQVTGLADGRQYHYRVYSRDVASNLAVSGDFTVTTPDVTAPTVSIAAPIASATVSGTTAVTAQALDNVGIANVQFKVDGANLGALVTTAPYTISWDTTTVADGSHTLSAVARDAAGNTTTAANVGVTVNNTAAWIAPQDTTLNLDSTNYSTSTQLMTYTWPDNKPANAILMKFDLSAIPAGAVVQQATLNAALVASDATTDATYTVTANKVVGKNPVIASATGYTADGATAWTANACCSNGVPLAQADISAPYDTKAIDKTAGFKSWTLTTMVQEWLANPATNFGVALNSDASKLRDRYRYFASTENADPTLRPYLYVTFATDGTAPTVSVTAPAAGATVSGTISLMANASDNVGVAGVQFKVDGANAGSEDTAAPYSVSWNSGTVANGSHTITAVARDAAGNSTTSLPVAVTVSNDLTPPIISAVAASAITASAATISWNTDEPSDSQVDYGPTTAYGSSTTVNASVVVVHSAALTGLAASTTYHYRVRSRDAAGNLAVSGDFTFVTLAGAGTSLAARYPGDVGIEADPAVVFVERFDENSLTTLFARWNDINNGTQMSFSSDVPAGSPLASSLAIPWIGGGVSTGGHLYKMLSSGVTDTMYVRYYIKYPTNPNWTHSGIWIGGYNPPLAWPNPQAGLLPAGNDRFSGSAETFGTNWQFDHYDYWMGMHRSLDNNFWGNVLLNDPNVKVTAGQWACVEHMIKLNNPVTAANGEHAIWLNGVKISHLGAGFPNGTWNGGIFTQSASGTPFAGFQWRNDANLNLNYIWLQNYTPDTSAGVRQDMKFAHVVAATTYVGCLVAGSADTTPPTVSITAPAAGVTVSGKTVSITALASDNVGVAGVQFKLDGANLGVEDTTAPWSITWDTTTAANSAHTLTAVARDAAGNTTTSAGVGVTVSNAAGPAWPNEPAGMVRLNDQPWNAMVGNGWNYLRRTSTVDDSIVTDASAPFSPLNILRIYYSAGCCNDAEPSVHWLSLSSVKEIFTGWFGKLSSNWIPNPAGGGKITFLFSGAGQVYTNYYHPSNDGSVQGPPYRAGANTEWAPYGQQIWYPNVNTTWINNGEWHRFEYYYKWETTPGVSGDGIIRWWVDGQLNGNYTNVHFPASAFQEFQIAPTVQFAGSADRFMYIDHTYVSVK